MFQHEAFRGSLIFSFKQNRGKRREEGEDLKTKTKTERLNSFKTLGIKKKSIFKKQKTKNKKKETKLNYVIFLCGK